MHNNFIDICIGFNTLYQFLEESSVLLQKEADGCL